MSFDASDRPSKRRRTESSSGDDYGRCPHDTSEHDHEDRAELEQEQWHNQDRFRHRMEDIFEKYSAIQADDGDEINIRTGAIEVDRGHLKTLPNADYEDDCESFTSEEDGIMDDHDEDILDFLQDPFYKAPDWSKEPLMKPRSQTPSSWMLHDELRPLSDLKKHDLPSEETILRQFGSAGPAVLEVLKKQAADRTLSMLPTPEDTQASSVESHEDDDLSILPHSPMLTTPLKFVRLIHVPTPQPLQPLVRSSEHDHRRRGSDANRVIKSAKSGILARTTKDTSTSAKPLDTRGQARYESRADSRWTMQQRSHQMDRHVKRDAGRPKDDRTGHSAKAELKLSHEPPFVCQNCQKEFCSRSYLGVHEAKVCKDKTTVFTCPSGCKKSYQFVSGLRKHLEYFCPYKQIDDVADGPLPIPSTFNNSSMNGVPRVERTDNLSDVYNAEHMPRPIMTASAAGLKEVKADHHNASMEHTDKHASIEARRSRLSLRPLTRQPDYRVRKTLKEFLLSATFAMQIPTKKTLQQKAKVQRLQRSKIVKLKVDFPRTEFANDVPDTLEGETISAWQKQANTESDEDFDTVSGWQKFVPANTPSDVDFCEPLERDTSLQEEPIATCYLDQWPAEHNHNLYTPRPQMPTPPPDSEDLALRPRRE